MSKIEALKAERDALKARAEKAEAEVARLREALWRSKAELQTAAKNWRRHEDEERSNDNISSVCDQGRGAHSAYRAMAFECAVEILDKQFKAALAPVEAKHTTGPETYDDALERLAAKSGRSRVPDDYDSDNEG
jgi:chromosome segregation ATPase